MELFELELEFKRCKIIGQNILQNQTEDTYTLTVFL